MKLDANKIAEIDIRAPERVIWRADARAELFLRFFILFLGLASNYGGSAKRLSKRRRSRRLFYLGAGKRVKNLLWKV